MALNNSWEAVSAHRRRLVAHLVVRQLSQREIVEQLAALNQVNPRTGRPWDLHTVHHDIRVLKRQWREEATQQLSMHLGQRLLELSAVKRQAWADGDLTSVLKAIKQESELLGLEAPQKIAPTDPSGTQEFTGWTDEQRRTRLAEIFQAGLQRQLAASVVEPVAPRHEVPV